MTLKKYSYKIKEIKKEILFILNYQSKFKMINKQIDKKNYTLLFELKN